MGSLFCHILTVVLMEPVDLPSSLPVERWLFTAHGDFFMVVRVWGF